MKHKTAELYDANLDCAVAMGLAAIDAVFAAKYQHPLVINHYCLVGHGHATAYEFARHWANAPEYEFTRLRFMPSVRWEEGGRIIEREKMHVEHDVEDYTDAEEPWYADCRHAWATGATPLIAAMRAFVVSKFGDEVELP